MDIITTEFQRSDMHTCQDDSKDRGKKRTLEHRIQLEAGSDDKKQKTGDKRDCVPQDQIDRRRKDTRYFKCGTKNHQGSQCEYGWVYKTPPLKYTSNPNQEPVNQKARTDTGYLLITELGSEEDLANE